DDTPEYHVHEHFNQRVWENHALGRPILGTRDTVESFNTDSLRSYFTNAYTPKNLIISAVGNIEHARVRELVEQKFGSLVQGGEPLRDDAPKVVPKTLIHNKELEQS